MRMRRIRPNTVHGNPPRVCGATRLQPGLRGGCCPHEVWDRRGKPRRRSVGSGRRSPGPLGYPHSPPRLWPGAGRDGDVIYFASAALMSRTPSALAHSAGPASEAISQPFGSMIKVVGMPIALPTVLRSWNTLALASV